MTLITNISFAASQRFYTYNAIHSFREADFIVERIIVSVRPRLTAGYPTDEIPRNSSSFEIFMAEAKPTRAQAILW